MFRACRYLAGLMAAAAVATAPHAYAQLKLPKLPSLPGGARSGDLRGQAETAVLRAAGEAVGAGSPLLLDQSSAYPRAPAIADFHPTRLAPASEADLNAPLPPGDYSVYVTAYCTQFSIHAPGRGLPYKLGPVKGTQAPAISSLLTRGTLQRVSPYALNADSWRIQAGLPLSKWPVADQALVHKLIPEYEAGLQGDYLARVEQSYERVRVVAGLPPFETLLTRTAPGQLVLQLRQGRDALSNQTIRAERLPDMLYQRQPDGLPRQLPPEPNPSPSPWSEIEPGIFARYTIVQGHMGRNLMEFRITPVAQAQANAVTVRLAGSTARPARRGSCTIASLAGIPSPPTLATVFGMGNPVGQGARLHVGYPETRPAQDLMALPELDTAHRATWNALNNRWCCLLSTGKMGGGVLDKSKLGGHRYEWPAFGGPTGFIYTAHAGFADIGHIRDNADLVKFVYDGLQEGDTQFVLNAGTATLNAANIPADQAGRLKLAGDIVYADSFAHELETWRDFSGVAPQDPSAFSPEDLPSNLMGIQLAKVAITAGGDYNAEIDMQLPLLMSYLGAEPPGVTQAELRYVDGGNWVNTGADGSLQLIRRNFDGTPWPTGMTVNGTPIDQPIPAEKAPPWLTPPSFDTMKSEFNYTMTDPVKTTTGNTGPVNIGNMQTITDLIRSEYTMANPGTDKPGTKP